MTDILTDKLDSVEIRISRLSNPLIERILQIKQIEVEGGLSEWGLPDYREETGRADSIFLTGAAEDKIVAFVIARFSPLSETEFEADILNFGVAKSFREKGIGSRLFERLAEEFSKEKIRTVWLEVRKSNETAIKFYLARDFEIIQTRKNFYSNPLEDALLLKLDLKEREKKKIKKRAKNQVKSESRF